MNNNTRSSNDQGSFDKDESGVLGSGRGEAIEHQIKYLEEARCIVLNFDELKEYAVFLFGSRADGSAHRRSDIDIGVLGKQALPAVLKLNIEENLEESNIPLRVEVIDFYNADQAFNKQALKNRIIWNLPKDIELD
jgi:predicted nucleotidyltransferase